MTTLQSVSNRHDVNIVGPIDPENGTGYRVEILVQEGWIHLSTFGTRRNALVAAVEAVR